MSASAPTYDTPLSAIAAAPIETLPWQRWVSGALSLCLIASFAVALHDQGMARLRGALPHAPLFWLAFAAYYVALPASELVIYRRLWGVPASAFTALLRKLISNELLLGYSGELSFYLFARRTAKLSTSPFHAIKDVSVLSALAGNVATLAMCVLAWPVLIRWRPDLLPSSASASLAALAAMSVLLILLWRRVFSLPAPQLGFVAAVHVARLAATSLLMILMWSAALPQVPVSTWLALAAIQLVVTRLPFIPNKDLVFAGLALVITGSASSLGALMTIVASLLVATHVVIGVALVIAGLVAEDRAA